MIKKILKTVLLLLIVILISLVGWFVWASRANKIKYKSDPKEYSSNLDAKKAIIIYQKGRTNYSELVVNNLAKKLSENEYYVLVDHPGDFLSKDLSEYDVVIFGSPVYISTLSPVLEEYIKSIENYGNAKVVYCVMGMLEAGEEIDAIKETLNDIPLTDVVKNVT